MRVGGKEVLDGYAERIGYFCMSIRENTEAFSITLSQKTRLIIIIRERMFQ
jgi:hypothetical protein